MFMKSYKFFFEIIIFEENIDLLRFDMYKQYIEELVTIERHMYVTIGKIRFVVGIDICYDN